MPSIGRFLGLAVVLVTLAGRPATSAELAADFLALLRLLPESPKTYQAAPIFTYVDFRAVERAAGLSPPAPGAAFQALAPEQRAQLDAALRRVVFGPTELFQVYGFAGDMPKTVGFDWLDVDRAMDFGVPPDVILLLAGEQIANRERLQTALGRRGFDLRRKGGSSLIHLGGVPVFHRFEDNAISPQDREPADPFSGLMGIAARIAVLKGMVASARNWPTLEATLDAHDGKRPESKLYSLARSAQPAIAALAGPDAVLVQSIAFPLSALAGGGIDLAEILTDPPVDLEKLRQRFLQVPETVLPPYPLALVLDLQAGGDQINLIVLPYGGRDQAKAAAEVVAQRLATWSPEEGARALVETVAGTVEHRIAEADSGQLAFALVAVRYPLPAASPTGASPEHGPARVLHAWFRQIMMGRFSPLFLQH